ncbi:c-type cytochrome [Enterovibrio coralii]|uniref:Cytochrome C n=1 Tax=Enterovibrio coralii TaxID=294935 RepID=A0A135IAP3_9GAMM|nr:c-type cytochrome [Enterovibrio coralii]KXF82517.1 cytochrome C [Enterovibrio coralii]
MKKLALLLTLLASFTAHAQGDAEAGKAKSATCAACHSADGNSLIPANPVLAGQHEKYLFKQLKEFKLGMQTGGEQGRYNAVMAGMVAPLSEQDMADLAAFYASQTAKPGTTPESAIEVGEELYLAGDKERGIAACIACHGPRGNGTALSGFPKISGQHAEYVQAQLVMFRDGVRNNDLNGMMQIVAAKLTDKEIEAISQYVGGLH